jgi:hypothetical protein
VLDRLARIEAAGGRTFLLCTTLRAVKRAAERLRDEFERRGLNFCSCRATRPHGIAGPVPRGRQWRADRQPVFWEGVDVAMRCRWSSSTSCRLRRRTIPCWRRASK